MQNVINYIVGSVRVEVSGSYPERFFNLCARYGIEFWDMESVETGIFRVSMTAESFRSIRPVARKSMCRVRITEKKGMPFFANKFRKRIALAAGAAVFFIAAWVFTGFVWVIDIDGFAELDTAVLREALAENGVYTGAYTANVDAESLKNNILIKMPELSYVSVNFSGSHAEVTARKRTSPPEILNSAEPCDIISDRDGIITEITVKTGTPEVKRGDTVVRGQLLASGYVTGRAGSTAMTHADAEIRARTWQRKNAKIAKTYNEKQYTGREKKLYTVIIFGNRIKLYINSGISYAKCDKIIKKSDLELFGGLKLPISLETALCREYETVPKIMTDEEAQKEITPSLENAVEPGEDGEILNVHYTTSSDEKILYAQITAECSEKIGVQRKLLKG